MDAFLMPWEESDQSWTRPDGCSLHLSEKDYTQFVAEYWATQPDEVPDEYSRPLSRLEHPHRVKVVDAALAQQLQQERSLRFYRNDLVVKQNAAGEHEVSLPTPSLNFVELCLRKQEQPDAIADYIERWHQGKAGLGQSLRDYLGFTPEEWAHYMRDEQSLYPLLFARLRDAAQVPAVYRHRKSKGWYQVLAKGQLESTLEPVTVYQGLDGRVWVRPTAEFDDGRFLALDAATPTGPSDR